MPAGFRGHDDESVDVGISGLTNGALEAALMADGASPDQLYPLDVERALSVYDRIKQDLSFAQTFGQQQRIMVDNQADMALVVGSRAYSVLKAGGNQWKPVWDKVPVGWNVLAIPKGSRNKDVAQEFIRFASDPARSARFAELAAVGGVDADAEPQLNDKQRSVYALGTDHADAGALHDVTPVLTVAGGHAVYDPGILERRRPAF